MNPEELPEECNNVCPVEPCGGGLRVPIMSVESELDRLRSLSKRLADSLEMCLPDVKARGGNHFASLLEKEIAEARGVGDIDE